MPTYDAYCRAPLVDPACVALPDSAVHIEGSLERLIQRALDTVDLAAITPLDAVIATKLGGYADLPPMPNLPALQAHLPAKPRVFLDAVRAGLMIASANKSKSAMVDVLDAMRFFAQALPAIGEPVLTPVGADALRITAELYRRTGQKFLLTLLERLRVQLPDVAGMFHSFPFIKAFTPESVREDAMDEASQYFRRMRMLGTGAIMADALAITAQLAMYSGSARDASASKTGVTALQRYHGMPHGAFSADPYLAGRDPAAATDLAAICAQLEAMHDLLAASGDVTFAERMERIAENALSNVFQEGGLCARQTVNRFAQEETCVAAPAKPAQSTALLRALYALRRSVWMAKAENELALMLPYESVCLARMDGTPVRAIARKTGNCDITVTVETRQTVEFALSLNVPGYAQSAGVAVNGGKPTPVDCGKLFTLRRRYETGDTVTLRLECQPFMESGFRGSASVYCAAYLMALPLPDENAAWQYALDEDGKPTATWENGRPLVRVDACDALTWKARTGKIPPPPQGCGLGEAYELTLLPYADTLGRIAAFPRATRNV